MLVQDAYVLFKASRKPADVMVGVLDEACVDLHLAGQRRLEVVGHVVPGGNLAGRGR